MTLKAGREGTARTPRFLRLHVVLPGMRFANKADLDPQEPGTSGTSGDGVAAPPVSIQ